MSGLAAQRADGMEGVVSLATAARRRPPADAVQAQDLAITMLGAYVRPHDRTVWSGGFVRLLGEFGLSAGASRVALSRLVRRELLQRTRAGRMVLYTLTARSEAVLAEGDRRIFSLGRPAVSPESWTVLWHAIPQGQRLARSRLGRRLRFLGFGPVQDGMWVSPHDREGEVAEVLRQLGVESHVGVLVGRPAESLDFGAVVERAWNLDELSTRYREFAAEFGPYRMAERRAALDDRSSFMVRTRLVHIFRAFPFLDPELPPSLVIEPAARAEAIELFHEVYAALDQPAQRHFDAVTVLAGPGVVS